MEESREFAAAFAEVVERKPKAKKIPSAEQSERKVEVFAEGTERFEDALQKVSKGLLDVLYSQFGSKPQSFVVGGIAEEIVSESGSTSDSFDDEDSSMDSFEEDDND